MRRIAFDDGPHDDPVERERVCGLVVGQDVLTGAVHDQPALGGQCDRTQGVRIGEVAVFLRLYSLNEPERAGQKDEDGDDRPQQGVDAEGEELLIVSIYAHMSWRLAVTTRSADAWLQWAPLEGRGLTTGRQAFRRGK